MDFSKKVYGLILPKKCAEQKPVVNKTSIFGNDEDSDEDRPLPKLQKNESKKILMKKQVQIDIEKALQEDPNAFAYDEVYDQVQAQKIEKDASEKANVDRKPKFIGSLLKAADLRKKEDERRLERTVQREREAEKGLYDDKDAFVTESFRKKMREMKEEEERERKKRESEEQNDVTKTGDYSGFYRNMLKKRVGQNESIDCKVKDEPEDKELEERKENTKVRDELVLDQDQALRSRREGEKNFHHGRTKHTDKDVETEGGHKKRNYRDGHRTSKDDEKRGRRRSSESDSDAEKRRSHKEKIDVVESKRGREEERKFAGGTRKDERSKRRRSSSPENEESRTHKEERRRRRRSSSRENDESRTRKEERQKRSRGSSAENGGNKRRKESTRKLRRSSRSESDESRIQKEERRKKRRNSSSEIDDVDDERRHPKQKSEHSCPPPQQHTGDTDDTNDSSSSSSEEEDEQHKKITSSEDKEIEEMAPEKPSTSTTANVKDMFVKKNAGAAFSDAQARYFARKHAVTAAVAKE